LFEGSHRSRECLRDRKHGFIAQNAERSLIGSSREVFTPLGEFS
jgi:hypothetical protein